MISNPIQKGSRCSSTLSKGGIHPFFSRENSEKSWLWFRYYISHYPVVQASGNRWHERWRRDTKGEDHPLGWIPSRELTYPPNKAYLKMIFLFPRWDMLIPWRAIFLFILFKVQILCVCVVFCFWLFFRSIYFFYPRTVFVEVSPGLRNMHILTYNEVKIPKT